ncbi:MAG: nitroreductase family protein [Sedimenticola sp.]|nr:nitroreductase family protein [Sedimenticola sp.]
MNRPTLQDLSHACRQREPGHPVDPIFIQRWSPRAFQPTTLPREHLQTILEAARWAPSAYNIQPWRFIYSLRGDEHWSVFLDLLDPFNRDWACNASALVFIVSDTLVPSPDGTAERPSQTHSFDTGAAWAQLALQATALGYQAHAMAGILFQEATRRLSIPERYQVQIAVAIGSQASPATLPGALRERERPSSRLPLETISFGGEFQSLPET